MYICILYLFLFNNYVSSKDFTMIKEINNEIFVGGKNYLGKYKMEENKLKLICEQTYLWELGIMNGSDIGFKINFHPWPPGFENFPESFAFDTCLNWKQEHEDENVRKTAFDYHHWKYHTPSGDWKTMNYTCMNSFIKAVEPLDENNLWVCGTFGAFPRAFSVDKTSLKFNQFVDSNVMSCGRYVDESIATYRDSRTKDLYVASGWGLYRPAKTNPDIPDNDSTMLYSDWRLYRNLFTLPSAMTWVLSSDVNFINVVREKDNFLYFFGHEINNQYGLNNQEDRNAWQSFMLRICKDDLGFKYIPTDILSSLTESIASKYLFGTFSNTDFTVSPAHANIDYNKSWYEDTAHLPKRHFVTPLKINFGCYISKRPRAISDNYFWGETNVVYLNKLADLIFDPNRKVNFKIYSTKSPFGCADNEHHQIPLVGIFNRDGLSGTGVPPTGALCQLQINENIFNDMGSTRESYNNHNVLESKNAYEELMALSSTSVSNFYSKTIHRTNGYTLYPYWNQGVLIGDNLLGNSYKNAYKDVGKCNSKSFYQNMNIKKFLEIQNFSNTAWPNELSNRLTSIPSAVCQYSAAELYSFNATFVVPGVEFKKLFLIKDNITDYFMHKLHKESDSRMRRITSPLMVMGIVSTLGHFYRVVLCDFDNAMLNHGTNKDINIWYNWCIFRHTDQPYLYRQYTPMERRKWGDSYQYRGSSLLQDITIINDSDRNSFPINRDPQFHVIKDVMRKGDYLYIVKSGNISQISLKVECKSYTKCIDCASDPDCMWSIKNKRCVDYRKSENFNKDYAQDVLDRGFRCLKALKKPVIIFKTPRTNDIFQCVNAGFWRGNIEWKVNGTKVVQDSEKYIINTKEHYLIIFNNIGNNSNISCHGVMDDHDRLYGDKEYQWITEYSELNNLILLNLYVLSQPEISGNHSPSKYIITILTVILIGIIIIVILNYFTYFKKRLLISKRTNHVNLNDSGEKNSFI